MKLKLKLKLVADSTLLASIKAIGTKRAEYDAAVQDAAMQVIGQSWAHRNVTPAIELVKAVSKHDRATLVTYLEKFGQMKWDTKAETLAFIDREGQFKATIDKTSELLFAEFEDAMTASKWYDAKKPPVVKSVYDGPAEISNLLDRLFKKAGKGATIKGMAIVKDVHAAYCAAVAKHYGEEEVTTPNGGQVPAQTNVAGVVQADRVNELAASATSKATSEQLAKLAEHFNPAEPQVKAA